MRSDGSTSATNQRYTWALFLAMLCLPFNAGKGDDVRPFPAQVKLEGQAAQAQVIFQRSVGEQIGQQVTSNIEVTIAEPGIARWHEGHVEAVSDGSTELVARTKNNAGDPVEVRVP